MSGSERPSPASLGGSLQRADEALRDVRTCMHAGSPDVLLPASGARAWSQWTRLVLFVGVAGLAPLVIHGDYQLGIATLVLIYTVVSLGFYLIFCLTGQFSFAQAAMFGLGAYCAAWADRFTGFWFSMLVAVLITTAVAALFLLIVNRASELYFAIATLGFAEIAILVFQNWTAFTASGGEASVAGTPVFFGVNIASPAADFWLALGFATAGLFGVKAIELSPLRRSAIAVRDRERVAGGLGVNTLMVRVLMFGLGSAFAAAAGALFATTQGFIDPQSFSVGLGIDIFLIVILGGVSSMWGCVIGSVFVVALPDLFAPAATYSDLIFAGCLLVVIFLLPGGLVSVLEGLRSLGARVKVAVGQRTAEPAPAAPGTTTPAASPPLGPNPTDAARGAQAPLRSVVPSGDASSGEVPK